MVWPQLYCRPINQTHKRRRITTPRPTQGEGRSDQISRSRSLGPESAGRPRPPPPPSPPARRTFKPPSVFLIIILPNPYPSYFIPFRSLSFSFDILILPYSSPTLRDSFLFARPSPSINHNIALPSLFLSLSFMQFSPFCFSQSRIIPHFPSHTLPLCTRLSFSHP